MAFRSTRWANRLRRAESQLRRWAGDDRPGDDRQGHDRPLAAMATLNSLFPTLGSERFLREYWPDTLYVEHGPRDRLDPLAKVKAFSSVDAFFEWAAEARYAHIQADLPDRRDESNSIPGLAVAAAKGLYGAHLSLRAGENFIQYFPEIAPLFELLADELSVSGPGRGRTYPLLYISPPGEAASCHFDSNANIVFQLAGRKRWTVAPNTDVSNPTQRYNVNFDKVPSALRHYVPKLPKSMPANAWSFVLEPGSVLFLPRGWWHATEGVEASLSVNFVTAPLTWASLLCSALRKHLETHTEWRAWADGLGSRNDERRRAAEKKGSELLTMLPEVAGRMSLGDALGTRTAKGNSPTARFRPVKRLKRDGNVLMVESEGWPVAVHVPPAFSAFLDWLIERREPFSETDMLRATTGLGACEARRMISVLQSAGAVSPVPKAVSRQPHPPSEP